MKVYNFKSFEGEHYVGPFTKFTSIIGPNGGGNMMIFLQENQMFQMEYNFYLEFQ